MYYFGNTLDIFAIYAESKHHGIICESFHSGFDTNKYTCNLYALTRHGMSYVILQVHFEYITIEAEGKYHCIIYGPLKSDFIKDK